MGRLETVMNKLNADSDLDLKGQKCTVMIGQFGTRGVVVMIDNQWAGVARDVAQDVQKLVAEWPEVTGPVVIRWMAGGQLGVYFNYNG